jgi:hypothetical protein
VLHLRRFPGFPVELGGAGELHAAFLTESRTLTLGWSHVQEIRVASSSIDIPALPGWADVWTTGPPGLDGLLGRTFHRYRTPGNR